ncbi:MAG: DUF3187 family protein [Acidobacteriota bacterium]
MRHATLAVLLLLGLSSTVAFADDFADDLRWRGPLRVRTQFPLDLLSLDLEPDHGGLLPQGLWALDVSVTHSNTFEITEGFDIARAAFDSGASLGDWAFVVDAEVTRFGIRMDWVPHRRVQLGIEVPALSYSEGFLDGIVDDTHDTLGLPGNDRDLRPQDQLEIEFLGGRSRYTLPDDGLSFGDVTLSAKIGLYRDDFAAWALRVSAKAPTGDEDKLAGSGSWDFGLALHTTLGRGNHYFHGGLGWYVLGDAEVLPVVDWEDKGVLQLGYEWRANGRWSVVAHLIAATSALPSSPQRNDDERIEAVFGFHYGRDNWQLSVGVIENITTNDNTQDLGIHVGMSWWL